MFFFGGNEVRINDCTGVDKLIGNRVKFELLNVVVNRQNDALDY